jgi:ABC-type transport system substrate-binding protein
MKRTSKRTIVVALIAAGVLAGGAVAYWTTAGSGSASASVKNPDPVSIASGAPTGFLYPGTSADLAITITNPNPVPVNLPSLVRDTGQGSGGFGVDGAHSACGVSALAYTTQSNGGAGWTVPANATNWPLDLANAVSLSTAAATECQGASFKVYLAVGS